MAKRKPKQRRKPSRKAREHAQVAMLRQIIREATKTGATEAIEHCANFWSVSDGFKKYIDHQVETAAEALMAAVRTVVRDELTRVVLPGKRRKPKP